MRTSNLSHSEIYARIPFSYTTTIHMGISHPHTLIQREFHFDTRHEYNKVAGAWDHSQEERYTKPHLMVAIQ
jgi:hypothetical protein